MAGSARGNPALAARDLPVLTTAAWYANGYIAWRFLTPGLDRFASLGLDDIGLLWMRNAAIMLVVFGGQHYILHIRQAQGTEFKYKSRWPAKGRRSFTFDDQVKVNMLWSLGSAATVAALHEALIVRLPAGGSLPELDVWWTVAAIPLIEGVHIYANHRLLHLDPLFSWFLALRHRNVSTLARGRAVDEPRRVLLLFVDAVRLRAAARPPVPGDLRAALPAAVAITVALRVRLLEAVRHRYSGRRHLPHPASPVPRGEVRHAARTHGQVFGTWHDGSMEAHEVMKDRKRQTAEGKDTDAVVGDSAAEECQTARREHR